MLRIYMLGSGPIAVPVLDKLLALAEAGAIELLGAGTQPDRPAGRKRQLMPTPVGAFAAGKNMAIDKFVSLNDGTAQARLEELKPDFLVVVSYGQLLKKPLLELPRYGCVNVHASLLPRYRGASPIAHAIANGDEATGVCFMDMEVGLDCGKVYRTLTRELEARNMPIRWKLSWANWPPENCLIRWKKSPPENCRARCRIRHWSP